MKYSKKKILFLDDQETRHKSFRRRYRKHNIMPAYTSCEAIDILREYSPFDEAHLDHDLGGVYLPSDEISGYEVARFISEMEPSLRPSRVIVHSWNPSGAFRMVKVLKDSGVKASYEPFS